MAYILFNKNYRKLTLQWRAMHQSFVTIAHHLRGWAGIAGLMCKAVTFCVHPQCRGSARLVLLHKYIPVEITIIKSGAMIVRRSPQCRAFNRAVIYEKSLSPLFPVGGGNGYKRLVHSG